MQIIVKLLKQQPFRMSEEELQSVVQRTDGYSGADVANLCKEAALGPIRSLQVAIIKCIITFILYSVQSPNYFHQKLETML